MQEKIHLPITEFCYYPFENLGVKTLNKSKVRFDYENILTSIKSFDFLIFAVSHLKVKLNKDGSFPKNLNHAFYFEGAIEKKSPYGNSYDFLTDKGKVISYCSFNSHVNKIVISVSFYDEENMHFKAEKSVYFPIDLCCTYDVENTCKETIAKLKAEQTRDINKLQNLPLLIQELEKINYYNFSPWIISNWLS